MKKLLIVLVALGALAASVSWMLTRPPGPKVVDFAKVTRQRLETTLTTNGKVEPVEFASIRAEIDGPIKRLAVEKGQPVAAGQVLAELDVPTELPAAESRVAAAISELQILESGGGPAALAEIDQALAKIPLEMQFARQQIAALERLVAKQAEPRQALVTAQEKLRQLESDQQALRNRRSSLLPPGGKEAAQARLRDAQAAVAAAKRRLEQAVIRTPIAGTLYSLAVRKGGYLRAGDPVAEVGRTETLMAVVYVDEPELGKVARGMPVRLTWDAAPGREWRGEVEKLPAQVIALGTRQVGEVACRIPNREGLLPPGANVQAEIQSKVVERALTAPKSALRREGSEWGVFALDGDKVAWRLVKLGSSSVTMAEIAEGLSEGDAVALATENPLKAGDRVIPKFP